MLALLLACTSPAEDTAVREVPAGCEASEAPLVEVTAASTTLRATWTTPEPVRTRVVYDDGDGRERATPWEDEPSTTHEHVLWAMVPGSEVTVAFEDDTGGASACVEPVTATVGQLPVGTPQVQVDRRADVEGLTVVPVLGAETWIVVLDEEGRTVWAWHMPEEGPWPVAATFRARLARDRRDLLFNFQVESAGQSGGMARVGFDGEIGEIGTAVDAHTDFVELPDGSWATLGWDVRSFDDDGEERKMLGDTVIEVTADGVEREVWNVFDDHEPDLGRDWMRGWYTADPEVEDWSHVNSITYDEVEDDFLVTTTFNDGVVRIDRATGEEVWSVGSYDADVTVLYESPPLLSRPHSVEVTDAGLLVFNRNGMDSEYPCSSVDELAVDVGAGTVTRAFRYAPAECPLVNFLGNAKRLDNGNTMGVFSSAGSIDEVTPEGELVMRWSLLAGAIFGFGERVPSPG